MALFQFGPGNDTQPGSVADDQMFGGGGDDNLSGLDGNDAIFTANGNDTQFGGLGDDTLTDTSTTSQDGLFGGDGNDAISISIGVFGDLVDGGTGTDRLSLNYSAFAGGGLKIVMGASFFVRAGGAQTVLVQDVEALTVQGTQFDDKITTGAGDDVIIGRGGFDTVRSGGGDDVLDFDLFQFDANAGGGTDKLIVDYSAFAAVSLTLSGNFTFVAGGATNSARGFELVDIETGVGNDSLTGGALGDKFSTSRGADTVNGGGGNDTIQTFDGADLLDGGTGDDLILVSSPTTGTGCQIIAGFGNDTVSGSSLGDTIDGGGGNDSLTGGTGKDSVDGGAGNDSLTSRGGDTMNGGSGDDIVWTFADSLVDLFTGGGGNDILRVHNTIFGGTASATQETLLVGGVFTVMFSGLQVATATGFERYDLLGGAVSADTLRGGAGDDTLAGSASTTSTIASDTDQLFGAGGNDSLAGRAGADVMDGGTGDDTLDGGDGSDAMAGGTGADSFIYGLASDSVGLSEDVISDFVSGTDQIDLHLLLPGAFAFSFIGNAALTGASGEVGYSVDAGGVTIYATTNLGFVPDLTIRLLGVAGLTINDFVL